ncbi:UDP-glucose--hexose-1-phosphate uridylyltransferase [Sulfidibacter corallicola]|uniref:Galactose-1-phosphate uridylyltransferase n=1 Tax=Sulfidibacter corallicola TaxID=2818388 RepID=A0A8A4TLV2_SULCO|nr:UDP-glucose--hexose-1-phosphate uridylyltransferase [Sulfidibacter corallicola]QTD47585.1 UDP-glucose--hexose-1-phosphate uridylyltransferase [Sulfidibacter corallicola]
MGPHRRFDPLSGRRILVSPQRNRRPWQGQREPVVNAPRPAYDENCYLCPGNRRANGRINPAYSGTFVFDNDFPALLDASDPVAGDDLLFRADEVRGRCRVLCYAPRHDLGLGDLGRDGIRAVIETWIRECASLGRQYSHVQIFENRGAQMGCSNPHPHGQIWATDSPPELHDVEDTHQRDWFQRRGRALLLEVVEREAALRTRVVAKTNHWLAIVPFWAVWPFELLLLPRFPISRITELRVAEQSDLAEMLERVLACYDGLFDTTFPYSFGWHGAPQDGLARPWWQLHAHFYPPLLRSAGVRKFMVGYELLAESQRDLTPETAAETLRAVISGGIR